MNRAVGLIALVLGVVVGVLGALPTDWFGRLNGVGGTGHRSADVVVALGVVLLIVGIVGLMRRPAATKQMNRRTEFASPRDTHTGL